MPLRVVHPAPQGQGTAALKRRRGSRSPTLTFNAEETRLVRATLKNAARAFGGYDVLAAAMGVPVKTLYQAVRRYIPSGMLAIRLAAAAGTTVEAMLTGRLEAAPAPSGSRGGAA